MKTTSITQIGMVKLFLACSYMLMSAAKCVSIFARKVRSLLSQIPSEINQKSTFHLLIRTNVLLKISLSFSRTYIMYVMPTVIAYFQP